MEHQNEIYLREYADGVRVFDTVGKMNRKNSHRHEKLIDPFIEAMK